jgi:heme-degrading monooxygenase HmoA
MAENPTEPTGVVIINIFTIPEGKTADDLLTLLRDVTREVMRRQPGFRSARLHVSLDGSHVANYAVWESEDAFRRVMGLPEAREHMERIARDYPRDARFYRIVDNFTSSEAPA